MIRMTPTSWNAESLSATSRTQWGLKIGADPGAEIKQGEIGTSTGPLLTSGLYTCVAVGLSTRDKTFLAHVDAGCCPSILAHWIDTTFSPDALPTLHLWNHAGAETPLLGHAAKIVDQALALSRLPKKEIVDHGMVSLFDTVTIDLESA